MNWDHQKLQSLCKHMTWEQLYYFQELERKIRSWDQSCLFQAFISLQSPKVPFFSFFFSFSWHAASEQKFDMDCAFKNHGTFLPFFQICHLETLLVQNQEKLADCYQLEPLGKVYFWDVMKSCTRCHHDHSSQLVYLFIYLQAWGTAMYLEAVLTP